MVDPGNVGRAAARRLLTGADDTGISYVKGPARYTSGDVAGTFAALLDRPVRLEIIPSNQIEEMFAKLRFSPAAARSYAKMTAATLDDPCLPDTPDRGSVTLWNYLSELINRSS